MTGLDFLPSEQRRLFVGGRWTDAEDGSTFDVLDPADGSVLTPSDDLGWVPPTPFLCPMGPRRKPRPIHLG